MKTFLKFMPINFAIIIGNVLLSHGLFGLSFFVDDLFRSIGISSDIVEHLTLFVLYALQILINILLYKTLLKKIYSPPEQKSLPLYLLLPVIAAAIWVLVFKILLAMGYEFDFETYLGMLVSFLPLFLLTIILVSIIFYLFLKKYVGEIYYAYILSVLGVISVPIVFFFCSANDLSGKR